MTMDVIQSEYKCGINLFRYHIAQAWKTKATLIVFVVSALNPAHQWGKTFNHDSWGKWGRQRDRERGYKWMMWECLFLMLLRKISAAEAKKKQNEGFCEHSCSRKDTNVNPGPSPL